ncbi:MAG: hypothetical protein ACYS8W_00040 [Planctomycetota bacterium]|jgi:hypothetical protein
MAVTFTREKKKRDWRIPVGIVVFFLLLLPVRSCVNKWRRISSQIHHDDLEAVFITDLEEDHGKHYGFDTITKHGDSIIEESQGRDEGKGIVLYGSGYYYPAKLIKNLNNDREYLFIEFDIMLNPGNASLSQQHSCAIGTHSKNLLSFDLSDLSVRLDGKTVMNWTPDKWYHVRLRCNYSGNEDGIYVSIDGDDFGFRSGGTFNSSYNQPRRNVVFSSKGMKMHLDNIRIYAKHFTNLQGY